MPNVLSDETWARLDKVLTYVEGQMRTVIPDGANGPNGPKFASVRKRREPRIFHEDVAPGIWIRIGSATQDGSNKRWKYDWTEYEKSTAGYGGWTAVSGGRTGHSSTFGYAYNGVEDGNGASGLYGNGVDSSNLTGTIDIQKVPPDQVIVFAEVVNPADGSLPELWFAYENGIDGDCP